MPIKKTQEIKELLQEYPEVFEKNFKALQELGEWLDKEGIQYKQQRGGSSFELEILEKRNKELNNKIKNKIKELEKKYDLCGYIEGVNVFTFGF